MMQKMHIIKSRIWCLINKINLSLEHRVFIDKLIEKANIFASDKKHQHIAYSCFLAYQWEKIATKGYNNKIIIKHFYNECNYSKLTVQKLLEILRNCTDDIKNCYDENI